MGRISIFILMHISFNCRRFSQKSPTIFIKMNNSFKIDVSS